MHIKTRSLRVIFSLLISLVGLISLSLSNTVVADATVFPKQISFQHPLANSNLALGGMFVITQDNEGFIWFGGRNGLVRFDGYNYKEIFLTPSLDGKQESILHVRDLHADTMGGLWIGTSNSLYRFDTLDESLTKITGFETIDNGSQTDAINAIAELPNGGLLIGSQSGLYQVGLNSQTVSPVDHLSHLHDKTLLPRVNDIYVESKSKIWLGKEHGLILFNLENNQAKFFPPAPNEPESTPLNAIVALEQDATGNIWAASNSGLLKFDSTTKTFTRFKKDPENPNSICGETIWKLKFDKNNILWLATDDGGLNIVDPTNNKFHCFLHDKDVDSSINSDKLRSIFEDRNGDIWVGAYPNGVNYFDRSSAAISIYTDAGKEGSSLSHNSVLAIQEDEKGNFWLGTDGGGLNYFNTENNQFSYIKANDAHNTINSNSVLSLLLDSRQRLWIGTWWGGVNILDTKTQTFTYLPIDESKVIKGSHQSNTLHDRNIWCFHEDQQGEIWIGTHESGVSIMHEDGSMTHYAHDENDPSSIANNLIWHILEDQAGHMWIGTANGLSRFDRIAGDFKNYFNDKNNAKSLSNNSVLSIHQDRAGHLWFGTDAGLNLYNPITDDFRVFTTQHGLANDVVRSIIEDEDGMLWLSTNDGFTLFDPQTYHAKNYTQDKGKSMGAFNTGASIQAQDGRLVFGGVQGLRIVHKDQLSINTTLPPIALTGFQLFTNPIQIDRENGPLFQPVNHAKEIILDHKKSMFSFTFSALSYRNSNKNQYAYKLEGFDSQWRYVGTNRKAVYTNIDAGEYTFRVKGSNSDGIWNESGKAIKIVQLPPLWKTWWAYTLYIVFMVAVVANYIRVQKRKIAYEKATSQRLRLARDRLQQLDKMKDDFLANISHELRTPLNGIIGLSDSLIAGAAGEINDMLRSNLQMISISGQRLATLVNDILDFSKLKNKKIHIHQQPVNLHGIVNLVMTLCSPSVEGKPVEMRNTVPTDLPSVLADENRLQQILYNLIGNATKFTKEGFVEVSAEVVDGKIWVKISDSGIGIPEEMQEKIFNSFEQVEDHENREFGGTGLGLTVTKQLVELHEGVITVESEKGSGSTFSFSLNITEEAAKDSTSRIQPEQAPVTKVLDIKDTQKNWDKELPTAEDLKTERKVFKLRQEVATVEEKDNSRFNILIVDDDPINRQVLLNQLNMQNYQTAVAESGQDALHLIETSQGFDLILLDIMMPKMSGYEVCQILRENHPIYELPIIFLTAKNLIEDLIDGFEVGANDFLTKPISIGELNSRVRTHLQLLDINKNLDEKVRERTNALSLANQELKTLDGIVATINQEVRIDRLIEVVLGEARTLFPLADHAAFWRLDDQQKDFTLVTAKKANSAQQEDCHLPKDILEKLFLIQKHKLDHHIFLLDENVLQSDAYALYDLQGKKSLIVLAMMYDNALVGVLTLASSTEADAFNPSQLSTFERFRTHVVSALSKSKLMDMLEHQCHELEKVSLTDQLTGLRNRRFLFKYIDTDVSLIQRKHFNRRKKPQYADTPIEDDFVFFLIDIDFFKEVNDSHGHLAGDKILSDMGKLLADTFRNSDYQIRWGGEEFLIVARFCDRAHAPQMAEKLRLCIESHDFSLGDGSYLKKTCSIGFACYPFLPGSPNELSWSQVVDIADHCLYAAKKTQRNAWVGVYGPEETNNIQFFKHIVEYPEQLIKNGEITLSTNIPKPDNILWK